MSGYDAVTVSTPPRAEFLHVIRAVVGSVAAHRDLPLDGIEDLRIAVTEACTQLIRVGGTSLTVSLAWDGGRIEARCRTNAVVSTWPPEGVERTLAAQVLRGLTDEVAWETFEGLPTVRLGKRTLHTVPGP